MGPTLVKYNFNATGNNMTLDIGNKCVYCGVDTAPGSGNFVNRIPAGTEEYDGYMCATCQLIECDVCGAEVIDYEIIDGLIVCADCLP